MEHPILNTLVLEAWKEVDKANWQSMALDIAQTFLEHSTGQFGSLVHAWEARDFDRIKEVSHSLKSSCGNVGARRAQVLLFAIEACALKRDEKALNSLMGEINQIFELSVVELELFTKVLQAA